MELEPNPQWGLQGLTECIALFEDTETGKLVEERVDEFLECVTSCDPFVQPLGHGDRYSAVPEFEFDIHSLEVKVSVGFPWGVWMDVLKRRRPDWLLNPCDKDSLTEDVVDEILTIRQEVEGTSSIPERYRCYLIWDMLSGAAQDAVDASISEAEWRGSGRDEIRSSLVVSISTVLDEEIEAWKQELDSARQRYSLTKRSSEPVAVE
ncbi:hypothetical protein [Microvirga sp. P5_D2]